jgi:hypothetical protein
MKIRFLLALTCCGIAVAPAFADDAKSTFDAGHYADAAKQLEPRLAAQPSAEGYYNLGLALEKAGDTTGAALDYQRALLLDPGLEPASAALAQLAASRNIPLPPHTWVDDVHAVAHPETILALGSTLIWIGAFGLLFALQAKRRRGVWNALSILALVLGGAMTATGWLTDLRLLAGEPAVVTAKDGADVLTEPANNSSPILTLPAGSPVNVLSPRGSWAYVDLAGGAKGWVQTERLTPLVPGETL